MFYADGVGSEEKAHCACLWPSLPRTLVLAPVPCLQPGGGCVLRAGGVGMDLPGQLAKLCYNQRPLHSGVPFQLRSTGGVSLV